MKIEVGDKVFFAITETKSITGIVKYIPVATGDSWVVEGFYEGKPDGIYYIQTFLFAHLREKAAND